VSGSANPTLNPNYHLTTDTVDTLNRGLHAEITRGLIAALGEFAY